MKPEQLKLTPGEGYSRQGKNCPQEEDFRLRWQTIHIRSDAQQWPQHLLNNWGLKRIAFKNPHNSDIILTLCGSLKGTKMCVS